MSWSDEDDDNEDAGQPMSGFVWGNIKPETGQLEDDDRQRYPEPFRDQVENDRVQALSHLARSRSESIPEDNIRIVPTQIYADYDVPELSSSDGEDYDDDGGGGGGNDRQARSSHEDFVLTKTDPKMPAGAASTSNDKSENDDQGNPEYEEFDADQVMVDPYNVLRKDENGEDILRFSSLFAPAILEVDPRQANQGVLIIKKQSHRVIEDDDCVQFQWRDKIDDTEVDEFVKSADKTIVYHEPHPLLTVGHKPERTAITVPELSSSLFALIEQTEWDNSILWEGNCDEPGPVVQEISLKPTTTSPLTASFPILVEGSTEHQLPECPKKVRAFSLHKRRRRRYEFHAEHIRQDSLPECWASDLEGKSQFRQPIAVNSHLPSRLLPNYDLESMHWLDDVIWDDDEGKVMPTRPVPVLLDMNDGAMVFDEGDDVDDTTTGQTASSMPSAERFNVSLDQGTLYASYRDDLGAVVGKTGLQHALFAKNLIEALFPTDRTPKQWSNWHRPKFDLRSALALRASSSKATATASQMGFGQQRKFVPRRLRDVSARDGQLVLVEYIEPEPLLIQTTGMATELVTFYRQRNSGDTWQPRPAHGTTRIVSADMDDETPFLGKIRPGFCITALNNNMFAVPLVLHESRTTDFILVLSSSNATAFTLHELPATYLAGQIQPKMEVPALNSRAASSFMKRRLTVYMHRLLQSAGALQIAEVFAAFPGQSETAIRAKLKEVAEFQRSGDLSGWWTPRTDKPPVRESALWEMVTPEAMCAYDRMEAGRQALKDGFGIELLATLTAAERVFIARMSSEHPLKRAALYIEQQTRMTPWNLSSNFLSAVKGVCLLRLKGPGNPIAPGAGLCYLRAPTRAEPDPIEEKLGPTSALTGTNKDLRKLDMNGLRDVLLSFGVPLERIVKLLRWERVDLVRLKATEAARDGQENEWSRFARSQRNTYRAQAAQFLKDAQRVLEKQVAFISSTTEPDVKPEDDEEIDEMEEWAKDLESMMESELKDDDAVEYDKWMKQKRNAEAPKEKIEEKTEKRKKTVLRRRLKKTVTTLNQTSGETLMTVTMIDDQALIDAFLNDRLKFDAICAERPVPVAKDKARLRLGNKKRRRGRPSAHEILPPRRTPTLPPPQSKRRGRPKGSKNQQPDTSVVVAPEALMVASAPVVGLEVPFIAAPSPVFRMPEVPEAEPSIPAAKLATAKKAITVRCSRCKQIGHTKSNSRCPLLSGHSPATAV